MKIYDVEGFPNPARVRIALAEKGANEKVEFIPVDVMQGEHRTAEFRAKNPDATVPYAELDCGTCISQCTAITEYVDGNFEGPSLIGDTPKQRAVTQMMNLRAEADWGMKKKETAQATMRYLDTVLKSNTFLAGDQFTMADITAFAGLAFADFAKVEIPSDLNDLTAWRERVASRPSCGG